MQTTKANTIGNKKKSKLLISIFYLWTFVLIARPQDFIEALAPLRPALSVGGIAIVFYIFKQGIHRNNILANKQCRLYLYLLAIIIFSIPFAYYRRGAFEFFFTKYIVSAIYIYLFYNIVDNGQKLYDVIFFACMGTGLYLVSALLKGDTSTGRLTFGQMYDPNDMAFLAASFSPLNILFLSTHNLLWKRVLCLAAIAVGILTILMTGSRGGFVALCVVVVMLLMTRSQIVKMSTKLIIMAIVGGVVILNSTAIDFTRFISIMEIGKDYNVFDETGRLEVWRKGLELMLSNPLTGVGISCFSEAIGQDRLARGLQEIWQSPHNSLVQIGAETGILGLLLFMVLSINAFRIFGRSKQKDHSQNIMKLGEIAILSYSGHFVSAMFLSQAYSLSWVYFIGLSAVLERIDKDLKYKELK